MPPAAAKTLTGYNIVGGSAARAGASSKLYSIYADINLPVISKDPQISNYVDGALTLSYLTTLKI